MFEGKTLLTYFELSHYLILHKYMSIAEYNELLPWQVDVYWNLLKRELTKDE